MRGTSLILVIGILSACFLSSGCYIIRPSKGGGQTSFKGPRKTDTSSIALVSGYRIEAISSGLTFPTGVAFDQEGRPCVIESGYAYGEVWSTPRLVRLESGRTSEI